jgi:signal transduction histidine kinase
LTAPDLVDRLATHRTLGAAPRAELEWLAAHGRLRRFAAGAVAVSEGERFDAFWIVLGGHLAIYVRRGGSPRKMMEWRGGDVTGLLPYSRLQKAIGQVVAEEDVDVLQVEQRDFPALIVQCPDVTAVLVHVMLDRARHFTFSDVQDEKMLSLGKLAAGLAHELNNPASAVARSAAGLTEAVGQAESASGGLALACLSQAQLAAVLAVRDRYYQATGPSQSPIERVDREDALAAWLEARDLDVELAESLAQSLVTPAALAELAGVLDREKLGVALRWMNACFATRKLSAEIDVAASRIYELVSAIKRFTYLDQATAPVPVDVGAGVRDTLTVLQSKARGKSIQVVVDVAPDLPDVQGFGGELNQVWANLIDNAYDAAPEHGRVEVTAKPHRDSVVVSVIDNGPGIPDDIRDRVFDAFFTTKPIGRGTGLGLDIARRVVTRHNGWIDVDSRPGRTEFRVTLPVAGQAPAAGPAAGG